MVEVLSLIKMASEESFEMEGLDESFVSVTVDVETSSVTEFRCDVCNYMSTVIICNATYDYVIRKMSLYLRLILGIKTFFVQPVEGFTVHVMGSHCTQRHCMRSAFALSVQFVTKVTILCGITEDT